MKASLKRGQFAMAIGAPAQYDATGNVIRAEVKPDKGMLIWLGKVVLKQVEESKVEHAGSLEVTDDSVRARLESRIAGIAQRIGAEEVDGLPVTGGIAEA